MKSLSFKTVLLCLFMMLQGCSFSSSSPVEIVAELNQPSVNIAVSEDGRIFLSFQEGDVQVGELLANGEVVSLGEELTVSAVFGLQMDAEGLLWMIDNGSAEQPAQLVAWDTTAAAVLKRIPLIPEDADKPFLFQDFALDQTHQVAYIADMGFALENAQPALWRVDLHTGELTLVLQNDPRFQAEERTMVIDGKPFLASLPTGDVDPDFGLNPITIDSADEWLYFGAMKGSKLYRLATADLLNDELSSAALAEQIELVGEKPYSDGISIDDADRVYVTDLESSGIGVVEPDGSYRLLFAEEALFRWPDGLSCGPDDWMYVTVNQNHLNALYNGGLQEAAAPFHVLRFPALDPCSVGR